MCFSEFCRFVINFRGKVKFKLPRQRYQASNAVLCLVGNNTSTMVR